MLDALVHFPRRHWLILLIFCLLFASMISYVFGQSTINQKNVGQNSYHITHPNSTIFSLYAKQNYIYKSSKLHAAAALDFLQANPNNIFGNDSINQNVFLQRSVIDQKNNADVRSGTEHYFYQQEIQNIPVYGAVIAVHIVNGNEVYASSGTVVTNQPSGAMHYDTAQATVIAEQKAKSDGAGDSLIISDMHEYLLNLQSLGYNSDSTTYHVFAILVTAGQKPVTFATRYFVDVNTGKIVYEEKTLEGLLNRYIYDCHDSDTCSLNRQEGQPATHDADVDKLYDIMAQVYNYFNHNFGRDSYDGKGGPFNGYVHRADIVGYPCPNAAWVNGQIQVCDNMVDLSIVSHEMTHAFTQYTAGLLYTQQSGALNESNSDIFSTALTHQWTIGAGLQLANIQTPLRYLNDPPLRGQPDKLFSPLYACTSGDNNGIHTNMGVMSKAFYLMTMGGNFNGCTVGAIGEKSYAIEYRTLTHYLTPSANFTDMYIDFQLACNDLYGGNSATCKNVQTAMQATEMDQQPVNEQEGAPCLGRTEAVPACSSQAAVATPTPATSANTGTIALTREDSPNLSLTVQLYTDENDNGAYDTGEGVQNGKLLLTSAGQELDATTDSSGSAVFQHISFGDLTVDPQLSDGTDLGKYATTISQTGKYTLTWELPSALTQQPNTVLPNKCRMVTKCSSGAGKLQLCTFQCQ